MERVYKLTEKKIVKSNALLGRETLPVRKEIKENYVVQ